MKRPPRICRHCDEPIEDPADEVLVSVEAHNSAGPRPVYAHVDHVALLRRDPVPAVILAHLRLDALRRDL
ncbi:hypothetical protein ACFU96_45495 [Streptomyces sp. NPDC057620]|uniref:hypothetical protein n=1 Tax=Streptomyces sp. NPDC057620 TaxID=3346185 RepID=UPI0036A6D147